MPSNFNIHKNIKELTLLFVEDDLNLSIQMQNVFATLFKSSTNANNGKLGLNAFKNKLREDKKPYDLVITDIEMPIMNGIDMIKKIYEITPQQPIIIMSAYYDSKHLISLLQIGVDDFLLKPLTIENMYKSLNRVTQAIINDKLIKKHYIEKEKLNEELHKKNIALEKSLRIIEGLHNKNQIIKNTNIHINHSLEKNKTTKNEHTSSKTEETKCLNNIEFIICNISIKYNFNTLENELLKKLSNEIKNYADLISSKKIYVNLKNSFEHLANTVSNRPKCTKEKDINRIFTIIESFFYIYSKWQEKFSKMSYKKVKFHSTAIEDEINTIIELWNCKI